MIKTKQVSIIIVNYHVKNELFSCLDSITSNKQKINYELIVVDNDEKKNIYIELHKKFPHIIYISNKNKGFGQGNNVGAKRSKGEFLFFLNPDTEVFRDCIRNLAKYLNEHKEVGIVAPILYKNKTESFNLQGLKILTPFNAIFALSFINKLFPNNFISRQYWSLNWDKKSTREVGTIPGTAFMIRRTIFKKINGFDENFFLYFEELDLCKRVYELGWKIVMYPPAKVYHAWGKSTEKSKRNIKKIFLESRFYYFKKHFGISSAIITELILRINKYILIFFILLSFIIVVNNLRKYIF